MKRSILVISNGKGEDSIALTVLEKLKIVLQEEDIALDDLNIVALPLLGDGQGYKDRGYYTVASWHILPSHGFSSWRGLIRDLRSGLRDNYRRQAQLIARESLSADLIITVGDIVPALLASFYGRRKKIVHIATAVSAYLRRYSFPELWLFRKYVSCVVCRDAYTCEELQRAGVNAFYAGNPMMDDPLLTATQTNLGLELRHKRIVLVPSSREDAYQNVLRMLEIVKRFPRKTTYQFVLTLAPNLSLAALNRKLPEASGEWRLDDQSDRKKPLVAELLGRDTPPVFVVRGYFRDCLEDAQLALGMTGTGNEQIAGLGIPLVLLKGRSAAASRGRLRHYKKLLGDAVFIPGGTDRRKAERIAQLLSNSKQLQKMSEAGRERMGPPGGAYFIARKIWYYLCA